MVASSSCRSSTRLTSPGAASYDKTTNTLVEAKGSVARAAIRMAIGQLADYARLIDPAPNRAILVPQMPRRDLLRLAATANVDVLCRYCHRPGATRMTGRASQGGAVQPAGMQDRPLQGPMAFHARKLSATLEELRTGHAGLDGRTREEALREFLRAVLPTRWGVGTGTVVAHTGEHSGELDIIIFDALNTLILQTDASRRNVTVPAEGVHAVVEVASRLDLSKLADDASKLARLRALPRRRFPEQAWGAPRASR
jgi:hypothetical protein